jgi:hypothetical protein
MSPEERAAFQQRMRDREAGGGSGDRTGRRSGAAQPPPPPVNASAATTLDALFGPLPRVETRQQAWIYVDKQLKRVNLRLGITDGMYSEVLNGDELPANAQFVLNVTTGLEPQSRPGQSGSQNPLMPQRGGGDRGRGGGGRGR